MMAKAAVKASRSQLEIIDVQQGTPGWFEARKGIPTASYFSVIMAEGKDGGPSMGRAEYMHRLAGEIITGIVAEESFKSKAMERGNAMEPIAIADYERRKGVEVRRIGFAVNFSGLKKCGASPDGLVGFDGGLEVKTMAPHRMIPLLLKGSPMQPEHRAQVQGNMLVLERDWWDLKTFYEGMPDFTVKVYRDDSYIKQLHNAIEVFNHELNSLVEKLRKMGAGL